MKYPVYQMTRDGLYLRDWVQIPWKRSIVQAEVWQICPDGPGLISVVTRGRTDMIDFTILKRRGHVFIVWDHEREEEVTVRIA